MFIGVCGATTVLGDSVVGERHHKVWRHYAIITTTTMQWRSLEFGPPRRKCLHYLQTRRLTHGNGCDNSCK